ncbi:MAG: hypothetical protein IBJ18_06670 [Phycisphaerales bacterium]|nr:hypothetical protein [Phycisphaerales bacterium]
MESSEIADAELPTSADGAEQPVDDAEGDGPQAGQAPGLPTGPRYVPRPTAPSVNPRKVRGGVKIASKTGPVSPAWSAQRWMRLLEEYAPNEQLAEGIVYARLGQTKTLLLPAPPGTHAPGSLNTVGPGQIVARVQGRLPAPYNVDIRLPVFSFEQWELVLGTMIEEAKHVAGLLAGEVLPAIEDVFRPHGLRLFPQDPSDLAISCTCRRQNALAAASVLGPGGRPINPRPTGEAPAADVPETPFCKHVCCAMALVAERLGQDPFLIFGLRGLWKEDLLERLRQKRALAQARAASSGTSGTLGVADRPLPTFSPHVPGVTDLPSPSLASCLDQFWSFAEPSKDPNKGAGDASAESDRFEGTESGDGEEGVTSVQRLDLAPTNPPVSHPLLRRLGASPIPGAKFPLVGLLATCYDVISAKAMKSPVPEASEGNPASEGGAPDQADSEASI